MNEKEKEVSGFQIAFLFGGTYEIDSPKAINELYEQTVQQVYKLYENLDSCHPDENPIRALAVGISLATCGADLVRYIFQIEGNTELEVKFIKLYQDFLDNLNNLQDELIVINQKKQAAEEN